VRLQAVALAALTCIASGKLLQAQTQREAATAAHLESIRADSARLVGFLRAMPKGGDLHNHISGAVDAASWARWAAADGLCFVVATSTLVRPPCDQTDRVSANKLLTDSALLAQAVAAWSMHDFHAGRESGADHFFATFSKTSVIGNTHLAEMLAEVTSRAARDHVSYLELMLNADDGVAARLGERAGGDGDFAVMIARLQRAGIIDSLRVVSSVLDRAERRQRELLHCGTPAADPGCDVTVRYIYQVIRSRPAPLVFAQVMAGFELPAIDRRYVSFNLVAPEHGDVATRDFELHMRMIDFLRARHPAVPITLHAGELSRVVTSSATMRSHIRQSIEIGHAVRIGHGVDVLEEDAADSLLRVMAARHVLVEVALTSNDVILGVRGTAHPLAAYLAHGVPVALATDDEGVSVSDMTREYARAVTDQRLGYVALKTMARNSIVYSFADDSTKARLTAGLERAFERFERDTPR
jgi:hypothetical protein